MQSRNCYRSININISHNCHYNYNYYYNYNGSVNRAFTVASHPKIGTETETETARRQKQQKQKQKQQKHSLVVGGGYVGLSTALHLQRIGRRVTLIDSSPFIGGSASCSHGNAGTMAVYANVPINSPSLFRRLPNYLWPDSTSTTSTTSSTSTTRDSSTTSTTSSPLSIHASWAQHLPKMIPWAALFAWNCRPSAVEHTAASLGALLSRAESGWDVVWKQSGTIDIDHGTMGDYASSTKSKDSPWRVKNGYLILQNTKRDMESSQQGAYLRRNYVTDLTMRQLRSSEEVLELEPNLDPRKCDGGAWYFPDAWSLNDPGALLRGLASGLEANGGVVMTGNAVVDIIENNETEQSGNSGNNNVTGAVSALLDNGTQIYADEIVIAAGAHSKHLVTSAMGEFCPLETERGYSIQYPQDITNNKNKNNKKEDEPPLLTRAVCDPSAGWIATPMAGGLRVAGKVELGGLEAPPTPARFEELERESIDLLQLGGGSKGVGKIKRNKSNDWLGFRPTMPDALPVIGRSRKLPNSVFYAFGHHHVGWTLGGITGQLIAELVQGKEPAIDLSPYSLDRFRFMNTIVNMSWMERAAPQRQKRRFSSSRSFHGTGHARSSSSSSRTFGHYQTQSRGFSSSSNKTPEEKLRPLPTRMEHVSYTPGCEASDLSLSHSPLPVVTPNDVLIQVEYAGVGGTDLAQRRGNFNPKPESLDHHSIMGLEVSGIVAKVGEDVTDFQKGDRVAALLYGGGYSQYALAPQQQVLELPDNLSLAQGAAIPENFWTVYANLFEPAFGNLCEQPEEKTLLVHGGTGGIGSTALLLSKALGVQKVITTVSSTEKMEAAQRFGADVSINYTEADFVEEVMQATQGKGADVILCFLGGDYTPRNVETLAPFGRLVQLGLRRGNNVTFDFKVLMNKWGLMTGGHLRPRTLEQKEATRNALREQVLPLLKSGVLAVPEVMDVLRLDEAGKAHTMLEEGKVVGKIVLKPWCQGTST